MPTTLILGSNSFSGADLIDLMLTETDDRIVGVSRSAQKAALYLRYLDRPEKARVQFVQLDLNHDLPALQQLLAALRPERIVNFASQSEVATSWQHPEQWAQTNVVATIALASFLAGCDWLRRYLHISTPEVYGSCSGVVTEEAAFRPSTPYAASRAGAELMLRVLAEGRGLPLLLTRAANVYGAGQQLYKIIPRTAIYLRLGRTIELHGGGRARRSFIHVRDVSRGELAVLQRGTLGEAYHLATDRAVEVRKIVQRICELHGTDFDRATRAVEDRPGQDSAYLLDCSKARAHLGWQPEIGLDGGLQEVVEWIERRWDLIPSEPLEYVHRV